MSFERTIFLILMFFFGCMFAISSSAEPTLEPPNGQAEGHTATLPDGLVLACIKSGVCQGAQKWLLRKQSEIERTCVRARDLGIKAPLLAQLEEIQAQAAFLGLLDTVGVETTALCGGILNESISYIEVQPEEATLEIEEEAQLEAIIHCPPPNYICTGELNWKSTKEEVATVSKGLVKAVTSGNTYVLAGSLDIPLPNFKTAKITVGSTSSVDIALVMQSDHATWDYIGEQLWWCPDANACLGWPNDATIIEWGTESFWGLCGEDGEELAGRFQVEDPSIVGISLNKEGPFVEGPLDIIFTCENSRAKSDKLWFKPISEGETRIYYCITGTECEPVIDPARAKFGFWNKEFSVGTPSTFPVDPPGLKQVSAEVADELVKHFDDYRFAATAFGWHPGYAVPCSEEDWYFPEVLYWDLAPYRDFLDFTSDASEIDQALSEIRPICDDPLPLPGRPYDGRSVYSATMHAIQDFDWREDAFRAVIVIAVSPACWEWDAPDYCDAEKVSGYTSQDVITAAKDAGVKLIMINGGWGSYHERMVGPFQSIAEQTDGWYTDDDSEFWPVLRAFESAFKWISEKQSGSADTEIGSD